MFVDSIVNFVGYPTRVSLKSLVIALVSPEIGELGPGVFGVVRVVFLSGLAKLLNDG